MEKDLSLRSGPQGPENKCNPLKATEPLEYHALRGATRRVEGGE